MQRDFNCRVKSYRRIQYTDMEDGSILTRLDESWVCIVEWDLDIPAFEERSRYTPFSKVNSDNLFVSKAKQREGLPPLEKAHLKIMPEKKPPAPIHCPAAMRFPHFPHPCVKHISAPTCMYSLPTLNVPNLTPHS